MIRRVLHWLHSAVRTCVRWGKGVFCGRYRVLFVSVIVLLLAFGIPYVFPPWDVIVQFLRAHPLFSVVLCFFVLYLLFVKFPQRQVAAVPCVKDRIDLEVKARQTMAQILGGAALLGSLYFTAQTLRTSQETLQVNQETLRTTQEGQITERFTKAIDQLGRDNLAMRLGGIYALERIARDSAKDHWPVMEVLTAFVREQAPAKTLPSESASGEGKTKETPQESKLPSDIQTILTVLGRRTRTFDNGEKQRLNLSNTNLQKADLSWAQLQGANLTRGQASGRQPFTGRASGS